MKIDNKVFHTWQGWVGHSSAPKSQGRTWLWCRKHRCKSFWSSLSDLNVQGNETRQGNVVAVPSQVTFSSSICNRCHFWSHGYLQASVSQSPFLDNHGAKIGDTKIFSLQYYFVKKMQYILSLFKTIYVVKESWQTEALLKFSASDLYINIITNLPQLHTTWLLIFTDLHNINSITSQVASGNWHKLTEHCCHSNYTELHF